MRSQEIAARNLWVNSLQALDDVIKRLSTSLNPAQAMIQYPRGSASAPPYRVAMPRQPMFPNGIWYSQYSQ